MGRWVYAVAALQVWVHVGKLDMANASENAPPVANAGPDMSLGDADGDGMQTVFLDGSRSMDDSGVVTWEWSWDGESISGESDYATFPSGDTEVTLTVTDEQGVSDHDTLVVSVTDRPVIKSIAASRSIGYFLMEDGSLYKDRYTRGHGSINSPVLVMDSGVESVSAGTNHQLVVKTDGSLWAFGSNEQGQLGDGTTEGKSDPVMIMESGVVFAYAGDEHSVVVKSDGSAWGFGSNFTGKIGDGSTERRLSPVMVFSEGVSKASSNFRTSLFLMEDGSLWGAGHNSNGQIGEIPGQTYASPIEIVSGGVVSFAGTSEQTFIAMEDGAAYVKGASEEDGFVEIAALPKDIVEIRTTDHVVFFRTASGELWGAKGKVGESSDLDYMQPVKLIHGELKSWDVGGATGYYERTDGSIWKPLRHLSPLKIYWEARAERLNTGPVVGVKDIVVYTSYYGYGSAPVEMSLDDSSDDWQISNWSWEWDEVRIDGSSREKWFQHFSEGETMVTLTIADDEGLTDSDTFKVTVLRRSEYESWLLEYFSQEQLDSMVPDASSADPDEDGYSNRQEFDMGTNPILAFDPFTQSEVGIRYVYRTLRLSVKPHARGLNYTLWGSEDGVNWQPLSYETKSWRDELHFIIPEDVNLLYKVQITD